tara:strand:- start:130 stop:705 length:576 start_codon:yes stop_codon:yes gene_type:complete
LYRGSKVASHSGFTLLEVLITLAIISILTVLVMVRYGSFNSAVLLKNQAFELALDLREAQVYAISVRGDGSEFREEYGIYVNQDSSNNQQYIFWQDSQSAPVPAYNAGEELATIPLDNRFYISEICYDSDVSSCQSASLLHISFARPNFDATLRLPGGSEASSARILISPVDDPSIYRSVYITSTGLITVE